MIAAHFADAYTPVLDGVVRSIQAIKARTDAYVIAPSQPGHHDEPKVLRYLSVSFRPPYRIGLPSLDPLLMSRLSALPIEVAHSWSPFGAGELARRYARKKGIPLVFSLCSRYAEWVSGQYARTPSFAALFAIDGLRRGALPGLPLGLRDMLTATDAGAAHCHRAMWRRVLDSVEASQCTLVFTESAKRELLQQGPIRARVEVVRQGIDVPTEARGDLSVRGHYRLSDAPIFLFVGQLAHEKELGFLLEALAQVRTPFHLLLAGEGPHRAHFEARARELGIAERCLFLGAIHDKRQLADLYAQADLFLFPSLYETQGLVVMEAASFGLPSVVQAHAPGISDVLDESTGFFSERSTRAYAALVEALCRDPQRRRAIGERAKSCVVRVEQTVAQMEALYSQLRTGAARVAA